MVRILGYAFLISSCALMAATAFAQQAKFDPVQCEGRTPTECNDLMGSLSVPPIEREKTLLVRATALLQKHDLKGAIAEYREMTVINPRSLLAFSTLGFLESLDENWKDAVSDLKRAVELAPDQEGVRAMLIMALAKGGDCDAARPMLGEAKAKAKDPELYRTAEQAVATGCS